MLRRPLESTQYTAIRDADRLHDAGALPSIGSIDDSYDNALAESVMGLFKTELVWWEGPWRGLDDLELATLGWSTGSTIPGFSQRWPIAPRPRPRQSTTVTSTTPTSARSRQN